jgi:hypothetical protein
MPRDLILMTFVAASLLSSPAAVASGPARVALVDAIDLPERMDDTRARLRELVEQGIRERGMEVAVIPSTPTCIEPGCLPDLARAAGATDVLLARGGRTASRDYHIELSLWQAASGEIVPATAECSFCTGPQMADATAKAARPLLDRIGARRVVAAIPPPVRPAQPTRPAAASPSDKLEPRHGRQMLGWSIVGLGAVSAGAGAFIWNLDGKGTDCLGATCRTMYRTQGEGIALVAAGIVGVGVGLWFAMDRSGQRNAAVTIGPSGAQLAGRF